MITSNDLYDIYYSFLLIRGNIVYTANPMIVDAISKTLWSECEEDNLIRMSIASLSGIDRKTWGFVFHNNYYTFREIVKDEMTLKFLHEICLKLKELLELEKFDQAYDFVDTIHSVPLIISKRGRLLFYICEIS